MDYTTLTPERRPIPEPETFPVVSLSQELQRLPDDPRRGKAQTLQCDLWRVKNDVEA